MDALPFSREKFFSDLKNSQVFPAKRFRVLNTLAIGGTSTVYLVLDNTFNTPVVFKAIHSKLLKSDFTKKVGFKEATISRALSHPGLAKIYDLRYGDNSQYLVMEYLDGSSLQEVMKRNTVDYSKLLFMLQQLVDVVDYIHQQGIIHSDIKPSNIILTKNDSLKLIDFANARQDSANKSPNIQIEDDHFYGYSKTYSSPEVIGDKPATTSDDVFSVARITYELLSESTQKSFEHLQPLEKPAKINRLQWFVLKKALEPDKNKRYTSIKSFYRDFVLMRYGVTILLTLFLVLGVLMWTASTDLLKDDSIPLYDSSHIVDEFKHADLEQQMILLDQYASINKVHFNEVKVKIYNDVVLNFENQVNEHISRGITLDEVAVYRSINSQLLSYFPSSISLQHTLKKLLQEREMLINSQTITAMEIVDAGRFDSQSAQQILDISVALELDGTSLKLDTDEASKQYYLSVRESIQENDWATLNQLYAFAMISQLSEFQSFWKQNPDVMIEHAKQILFYLNKPLNSARVFPLDAVNYFVLGQLKKLEKQINKTTSVKTMQRIESTLLSIQQTYQFDQTEYPEYWLIRDKLEQKRKLLKMD